MDLAVGSADGDRYDRQKRIWWMDMDAVSSARVLVAGAGALGNEALKDLVLAGFRRIDVADTDAVEVSNLSRCALFTDADVGRSKCLVAASRASAMAPGADVRPLESAVQDIDVWDYDIALGCLDNIAARLHVNAHCMHRRIPYVDGGTDGMRGKVQTVLPGGPCIQCTVNRSHVREMERRFSCTGGGSMYVPRMASDITTTAVIAAMQVREALKIASGRRDLCISNITYYDGSLCEMFNAAADIDPGCPNHTG